MAFQDIAAKIQAGPPEQKASFEKAASTIKQHLSQQQPNPSPIANDNRDSNEAYRQNQSNQDKAAPALSPSDRFNGRTNLEGPSQSPAAANGPSQSPSKSLAAEAPTPSTVRAPMPTPAIAQGGGGRGR